MNDPKGPLSFEELGGIGTRHRAGPYVLTGEEVMEFSAKWDPFEFHLDTEEADASLFEGLAASGAHTICIANLLLHQTGHTWDIRAALGIEFQFPAPASVGDKLWLSRVVTDKRVSKSRPELGVVVFEVRLVNQDDVVVLEQKGTVLVAVAST